MIQSADQPSEPSTHIQPSLKVAFQGERGAFGDEATIAYFGAQTEPLPYRSFADVFRAVAAGEADYGLVPVENSQAGSINDVYDLLRQHDLFVVVQQLRGEGHRARGYAVAEPNWRWMRTPGCAD